MPRYTSAASASCGMRRGLTKLVASIAARPAAPRRSMNSILTAAGTMAGSFCRPSRGPTSTTRTPAGKDISGRLVRLQVHEHRVGVDAVADGTEHVRDDPRDRRDDRQL